MTLHLRVISGLQIGDQIRIEPPGAFIGRGEGCALHLRDESVSRSHVELRFQQDVFWAHRHSTRSLTLLDGVPLDTSPQALRDQGILQVGTVCIEYKHERARAPVAEHESPPTMVNVRVQLPAIPNAVLPQMTPMRAVDPGATPATLILRRPPLPEPSAETPPTLIRRPPGLPPPLPPGLPPAIPPSDQPPAPLLASRSEELARVEKERDKLRLERDKLAAELQRLTQENAALREAPRASPLAAPETSAMATQALRLLAPFGDSLEQTAQALQDGDASRARVLLRDASFGLADLRDLFESAPS